jgi:hypothetical protein
MIRVLLSALCSLQRRLSYLVTRRPEIWDCAHAVERGNRRHRKIQKSVYRVRSKVCLEGRIALDMLRESRGEGRDHTTQALHRERRGYT